MLSHILMAVVTSQATVEQQLFFSIMVETMDAYVCNFDILFSQNVPHIPEKIFLSMDYQSFKNCLKVNNEWRGLLTSERFMSKAKSTFKSDIS